MIHKPRECLVRPTEANYGDLRSQYKDRDSRLLTRPSATPKYSPHFRNYALTTAHHVHGKGARLVELRGMLWNRRVNLVSGYADLVYEEVTGCCSQEEAKDERSSDPRPERCAKSSFARFIS